MPRNVKKEIKASKDVSYTSKDFESLRNDLKSYLGRHFNNLVADSSDSSLAGLLIDLAAYVGDVNAYYIDHQFNESSLETAVETDNLARHIREAGVEVTGVAPAIGFAEISLIVPAQRKRGEYIPNKTYLPKIIKETAFSSSPGIVFYLLNDLDMSETDSEGNLLANFRVNRVSGGVPVDFIVTREGLVGSSNLGTETFKIPNTFQAFRQITIAANDVNEIVRVFDSDGDEYYEVESLTQSTVFRRIPNSRKDLDNASERIQIYHAPKRFVKRRSAITGKITLQFGSGNEDSFDEDVIPDPSDHAILLYGDRKSLNKVTIDPNSFLGTQTLGISPRNTTITVTYRSGGGLSHNVTPGQINSVKTLITEFSSTTPTSVASQIRASADVTNARPVRGGEDEPSLEALRQIALLNRNSQNRVVTREDLIARVYSMPANFGRVYRASVRDNPNNPQAAQLFIISRNRDKQLVISTDSLKESLSRYLSKFRIVSDAVDILDASVVNIGVNYTVTINPEANTLTTITSINQKIADYLKVDNFQIDQPIFIGEIENLILNTPDVLAIMSFEMINKTGEEGGRVYSNYQYDPRRYIDRGILFPPDGGMFELKFPLSDIVGRIS